MTDCVGLVKVVQNAFTKSLFVFWVLCTVVLCVQYFCANSRFPREITCLRHHVLTPLYWFLNNALSRLTSSMTRTSSSVQKFFFPIPFIGQMPPRASARLFNNIVSRFWRTSLQLSAAIGWNWHGSDPLGTRSHIFPLPLVLVFSGSVFFSTRVV